MIKRKRKSQDGWENLQSTDALNNKPAMGRLFSLSISNLRRILSSISHSGVLCLGVELLPLRLLLPGVRETTRRMNFQPVRLAYKTHDPVTGIDGSLSPIIYLHGATVDKNCWGDIPQVVANATNRKSYALDARNHGDSEWTEHFNFDLNVDDLVHFMDTLAIERAILVGHSMGGITAIKTALLKPDRVERIVAEDMFVRKCPDEIIKTVRIHISLMRQAIEKTPSDLDEASAKMFILRHYAANIPPELPKLKAKDSDIQDGIRFILLRRGPDGRYASKCNLAALERAMENLDTLVAEPSGKFDGPALFVYGKLSPFLVGADEHHIKQFFPNAVLEGIEDADHNVHSFKPLEFTDSLVQFLS